MQFNCLGVGNRSIADIGERLHRALTLTTDLDECPIFQDDAGINVVIDDNGPRGPQTGGLDQLLALAVRVGDHEVVVIRVRIGPRSEKCDQQTVHRCGRIISYTF